MALKPKPPAEVTLDPARVRALLEAQHPDLAGLPLIEVASGWDNFVFRLGDDLAVRLPRRAIAAPLIEREARWLPELAPRLPLAVPVPVRVGCPSHAFPWAWSVVRWLPGEPASTAPPVDAEATAAVLGRFLRTLHRAAPPDAPRSTWRGIPLIPSNKLPLEGGRSKIILLRTGESRQGVVGLLQPGLQGEQSPGLSVRFMGINDKAIASYLVSLYCSLAVLVDDAIAILDDVETDKYHEYKY